MKIQEKTYKQNRVIQKEQRRIEKKTRIKKYFFGFLLTIFILVGIPIIDYFIFDSCEESKYTWMIATIFLVFIAYSFYNKSKKK